MTNEQIKQNAEEYYDKLGSITIEVEGEPNSIVEAYIAGAHSRDEEIKELNGQVTLHKDRADYYHDLYMKLRNPWISVDERLPRDEDYDDENIYCFLVRQECGFIYNCAFDGEEWLTNAPDGEEWGVGGVTHWMPIVQIKKGE